MSHSLIVVLTGGPGGGKSTLIDELSRDPEWTGRLSALPEAIALMRHVGISPREKQFQCALVHLQMGMEDGLARALGWQASRLILCNRGSLDPLAYWLDRCWAEEEFFALTGTTREEHYRRYAAVIHLVTAADGAADAYKHWPDAHRHETIEQAIGIDQRLQQVWCDHPRYVCIGNAGGWETKANAAKKLLAVIMNE